MDTKIETKIIQIMPALNWWAKFKGKTYPVIGWALCEWEFEDETVRDVFGLVTRGGGVETCDLDTDYFYEVD